MDFHLKQWRNQHESEQQHSAKIPKLLLEPQQQPQPSSASAALPLFVPEPNSKISSMSAFPDSTSAATRFTRMGSFFSLAQWQELELQALIFRYMMAGAAVPPELLQPIKKSLLHTPPYLLHHPLQQYPHYQPALLQSGYWGRAAMDPEPGRCRRTDGKKWRCSRDVVVGQKYCERHVHRGRNRSRKPVEIPTPITTSTTAGGGGTLKAANPPIAAPSLASSMAGGTHFALSGPSPSVDLLHLSQSSLGFKTENKGGLFEAQTEVSADGKSDGHILRHFFDDWPRSSLEESDNTGSNASPMNSATCLSISMLENSSSDVSLKLSTGIGNEPGSRDSNAEAGQPQLNWAAGWATNQVASMGGPLAEALRSSTSNSSPTSVLHQLPRGTATEASLVST
ncbi:growth-regulating factor 3 isoform X2 [Alnus glutinosa]|uniref:growth-regulating factor 3 isoform X2 n=1 Tax=Alnus glutinosa TaxID=3517 RepID=UPI002D777A3D|nr:growth-regulating factor 3 isoform X2 [Alnus glutinosa]